MTRLTILILACFHLSNLWSVEPMEFSESQKYITETNFDKYNNWTGNIFGVFGTRSLKGSDFNPVDDHTNTGVMFDIGKKEWPIHLCLEYFNSSDSESEGGTDYDISVSELNFGFRYIIDIPHRPITLHAGGGVSLIDIELESSTTLLTVSDEQSPHGFWIAAGAYYRWQDRLLFGFDLHYTDARSRIGGGDSVNSGGWQTNLILGLRF